MLISLNYWCLSIALSIHSKVVSLRYQDLSVVAWLSTKEDTHLTLMTKQSQIGLEVTGVEVTGVEVNSSVQVAGQVCTGLLWPEAL